MNRILLLLIFAFAFSHAQYSIEENDVTENTKEIGRETVGYDLKNPLEFYRLKCENPAYAKFPGGENAFKQKLSLSLKSYMDNGIYFVNGTFDLNISLDKTGKVQSFKLNPDVQNANLFYKDVEKVLKKMNPKFSPAACNGIPVESKIRQKINFRTDNFEI